jgi:Bacterial regulatory proteins, lacI family
VVDVARAANVSVGTVSDVVSGARNLRHEMREQVERAITELASSRTRSRARSSGGVRRPFVVEPELRVRASTGPPSVASDVPVTSSTVLARV